MQRTTIRLILVTLYFHFCALAFAQRTASVSAQTKAQRNISAAMSGPCTLDRTVALPDASVRFPFDCSPPDSLQRQSHPYEIPRIPKQASLVSLTTLAAPKDAKRAYERAQKDLARKKAHFSAAAIGLTKAVAVYARFAAAWYLLGETRLALGQNELARQAFLRALDADPKYGAPYAPLALMELKMGRFAEAAKLSGHAVRLNPDLAEAHYYRAVANYSLRNFGITEESIRAILARGADHTYPGVHLMLGDMFAAKGDFQSAAVEYRRLVQLQPASRAALAIKQQLDDWEARGLLAQPKQQDKNRRVEASIDSPLTR